MSRLARIVVPGVPHHVTQRGNRRDPPLPSPPAARSALADWITTLEALTERALAAGKRGPKAKAAQTAATGDLFHTVSP